VRRHPTPGVAKQGASLIPPHPHPHPHRPPPRKKTPVANAKVDNTPKASSSSSSSSAAPAYTPPASSGSGKVGLAWPNSNDPSLKNFKTDKVQYLYTWSPDVPSNAAALGFTFIPQLWGDDQITDFVKVVKKGYANMVFGFNEPNEPLQSNMQVSHGVQLWQKYLEPLRYQGYQLISPATSSNPNGMTWVKQFKSECGSGCTFDGVAIHYYDITPEGFIEYIENWHNTFNVPVYPTEFACQNYNQGPQCSESQVQNFMTTIINYMENADWVPMYFAYGVMKQMNGVNTLNQLMDNNGEPTSLGQMYINGQ